MIPIRTDYRMSRVPWVNYALVAANVLIFVLGYNGSSDRNLFRIDQWLLQPEQPQLWQFFSSTFLHANWGHLLGNMVFLWVFGNAINDRFGQAGYLAFYLSGGVLASVGYLLLSGRGPLLGASGAISAVTGAYLVLLPRVRVTVLIWLFYLLMPIEISSLYFLLFQFAFNAVASLTELGGRAGGGVAYIAHSSGYLYGIIVAAGLLAAKALPRDPYDLLNLIRTHRRQAEYHRMVSEGYDPFLGVSSRLRQAGRRVESRTVSSEMPDRPEAQELQLRRQISEAASRGDAHSAATGYLQLLEIEPRAVLPRQVQLDVANLFMANEQYAPAAQAYERFLEHYSNYEHIADIHLMLGILYGRYLNQPKKAEYHLQTAIERLHDHRKIELARQDLEELRRRG